MAFSFKNLFGWTISDVKAPRMKNRLIRGEIEYVGYEVCVEYRNKNTGKVRQEKVVFDKDDERMYTLYNGPHDAAIRYYETQKRQLQRGQACIAARQK